MEEAPDDKLKKGKKMEGASGKTKLIIDATWMLYTL